MLNILFFGQLRDVLCTNALTIDLTQLTQPVRSVAELRILLQSKGELWQEFLSSSRSLVAVNQCMANDSDTISDGDEVALFPPVTGG